VSVIGYFSGVELPDELLKHDKSQRVLAHRTPLGVVAAIVPWNFPMLLMAAKLAPALVTGNTLVIKPAPTTPLTTLFFGEICAEYLPPGVVNIITDQNNLGDILTSPPDVSKVSFTGSTATGKKVMKSVAGTLKRLTLELGGNDAAILLDDVEPREIAAKILTGATINSGQVCLAIKRLYVHDSIYDQICDELRGLARGIVVGDGLKQGTQMGPLQNKVQFEKIKEYLEIAKCDGKIIAGGNAYSGKGYFIEPTIVRDISDNSRLVREEQFGPVLPVLKYSDIDDAIERANNTEYGLGGTVWSADLERAFGVARKMDAGIVWVNKHLDITPDVPISGAKSSGIGSEFGREGLEEFTQLKIINAAL
jgi:acyl-CoA reductase-like NAD-dependent aldehyde dehydrogenase